MTSRNAQVNLIIKARNEADRAITSATDALNKLFGAQEHVSGSARATGASLADMVATAALVDKAFSNIHVAADKGSEAFDRQRNALTKAKGDYVALRVEADYAAAALARLQQRAAVAANGPQQPGAGAKLAADIKQVGSASASLESQTTKLQRTITALEGGLTTSQSALQKLGSTEIAATQVENDLTAAINRRRDALLQVARAQAPDAEAQARSAAAAQSFFNARNAPALVAGPASSNGATFEALTAREDAAARREAAHAYELFEARVRSGVTAMKEADAAEDEMAAAAAHLRAELDPLAAIQERFNQKLREANTLYGAGKITAAELAQRTSQLGAQMTRAGVDLKRQGKDSIGLFGLRPYEVTNLGYQVNDLVTQIASGTSVTQAFAQQGGQILQLLPQIGTKLLGLAKNPFFLTAAVVFGGIAIAVKNIADQAERLRGFSGMLAGSADGASFNAAGLEKQVQALQLLGVAAKDATAAFKVFFTAGVQQGRFEQFTLVARDLSDLMGTKLPEAAKMVAEGFTGGYDAIVKLDEATNFLTASQREHIKALFDEGNATEARSEAFRIFADMQEDAANKARGPWAEAVRSLGGAWQSFIDFLSNNTALRTLAADLGELAGGVSNLFDKLSGVSTISQKFAEVAAQQQKIAEIVAVVENDKSTAHVRQARLNGLELERKKLWELQLQYGALLQAKRDADSTDPTNPNSESAKKRRQEELDAIERRRRADPDLKATVTSYADRIKNAGDDAYQAEIRKSGDIVLATAQRALAVDKERAKVAKDITAANEKQRAAWVADIGDNTRDKLMSTAQRFNGFSENNAGQRGDLQSFFKQNGINVDPKMTAWCAAFVNAVLKTNGLPDTGKLNARSFLNYGQDATSNPQKGDIVVLKRGNNAAQGHVGFFQGFDQRGNVNVLGGNTGDKVATQPFSRDDVLGIRRAPSTAMVATQQAALAKQLDEAQAALNEKVDEEIARRQKAVEAMTVEGRLSGEALLDAQKRAAVEDAVLKVQQDYAALRDRGADIDPAAEQKRLDLVRETAAAEFEITHQRQRQRAELEVIERPVRDLTQQRDAIREQVDFRRGQGDNAGAAALGPELDAVNEKLQTAIDRAITLYKEMSPDKMKGLDLTAEQIDAIVRGLEVAKQKAQEWGTVMGFSAENIAHIFADSLTGAIDGFAQAVGEGANVFKSLKDAFLNFAASFLKMIAQMILQQIAFNIAKKVMSIAFPGSVPTNHTGGIVGTDRTDTRNVSPDWFAGAMRMHTGGIAGLKPNEVPTILEAGEEVLTRSDPRHRGNGGLSGGGSSSAPVPISVIAVNDPVDALERALRTPQGERVVLAFMRENSEAIKGMD